MIEIDGGDGGGQLVRSALALSLLSGEAIQVGNVRGGRSEPGLKPQHLTAVETAAEIGGAEVDGAVRGSLEFTFDPEAIRPGTYEADIGTAGSATLLFDALLPLAAELAEPLSVTVRGGTDVKWSPPFDYLRCVKLPLLRAHGWSAAVDLDRRGFYPKGGGRATLTLAPSSPRPVDLADPFDLDVARVFSTASAHLEENDVAQRQTDAATDRLHEADVEVHTRSVEIAAADCPGSVVVVRGDGADGQSRLVGADALGERGKPAETVGEEAAETLLALDRGPGAVDEHLADQLLVPLALSGGEVLAPRETAHIRTSLDLLEQFGYDVEGTEVADGFLLEG